MQLVGVFEQQRPDDLTPHDIALRASGRHRTMEVSLPPDAMCPRAQLGPACCNTCDCRVPGTCGLRKWVPENCCVVVARRRSSCAIKSEVHATDRQAG
jgi:hypothetical protein